MARNSKEFQAMCRQRAKDGFGHDCDGKKMPLEVRDAMARSLIAGYKLNRGKKKPKE